MILSLRNNDKKSLTIVEVDLKTGNFKEWKLIWSNFKIDKL